MSVLCAFAASGTVVANAQASPQRARTAATITGHLNVKGYTVIVVGFNGKMSFSRKATFSLKAPDSKVTIQLLNSHGLYAGPVVFGGSKKRVIVGVKAGAKLGTIKYIAAKGYAVLEKPISKSELVTKRIAIAKRGVPIGNGRNFGLVRSTAKGSSGPGGDLDESGVPNIFNVAPEGNLILKSLEPSATSGSPSPQFVSRKSHVAVADATGPSGPPPSGPPPSGPPPGGTSGTSTLAAQSPSPWMSELFLPINYTVNADASNVTEAEIDAAVTANLNIVYLSVPTGSLVELNCNGLTYCSPGGTGLASEGSFPNGGTGPTPGSTEMFPAVSAAPDGNGELRGLAAPSNLLGTNTLGSAASSGANAFFLDPEAPSTAIGSGDVITVIDTSGGTTTQTAAPLNFVFDTVPALQSWSDTAGDGSTVNYPAAAGSLGTQGNGFAVKAGSNGDVVVTMHLWRPQRKGIPGAGEPTFMDLGHLKYEADIPSGGLVPAGASPQCSFASYSNTQSPLTLNSVQMPGGVGGAMVDSSADTPSVTGSTANTLSFTVDLTKCLMDKGATGWPVGTTVGVQIEADAQQSSDHADQELYFTRAG